MNFGTPTGRRLGGLKAGRENVQANQARKQGIFTPGVQARAARLMLHTRWHVQRNRSNQACWLCRTSTKVVPQVNKGL